MRSDSPQIDNGVVLASTPVASDGAVAITGIGTLRERLRLTRPRVALHPLAGRFALAAMILGAVLVVVFATAGPSVLVPQSTHVFPGWEA